MSERKAMPSDIIATSSNENMPKILVGTLYSGEQELPQCIESVEAQQNVVCSQRIFEFLPNKEAHDTLYAWFEEQASQFDLLIKLDADMVLIRPSILEEIYHIFESNKQLDHVIFSVRDWYSDTDIQGLHVYSSTVSWALTDEQLFVDPFPQIAGERVAIQECPAPVALHSPDPSIREAVSFGIHRAAKVVQKRRYKRNIQQAAYQLKLLGNVWTAFCSSNDIRRGLAVYGAEYVFSGRLNSMPNKAENTVFERIAREGQELRIEGIKAELGPIWSSPITTVTRNLRYVGLPKTKARFERLIKSVVRRA